LTSQGQFDSIMIGMKPTSKFIVLLIALSTLLLLFPALLTFGFVEIAKLMHAHWFFEGILGFSGFVLGLIPPTFAVLAAAQFADDTKSSVVGELMEYFDKREKALEAEKETNATVSTMNNWLQANK
jgi:hypothetical protein